MLTELPAEVIVFNTTFHFEYSSSYTGNVHGSSTIDFAYCMSLISAFEYLIKENYNSFILTIGCITVSIYVTTNGIFKIWVLMLRMHLVWAILKELVYFWKCRV